MIKNDKFAIYKGKEYRLIKFEDGTLKLISHDRKDMEDGFELYERNSDIYTKQISKSDLESVYRTRTFALYKGYTLGIFAEYEDEFLVVTGNWIDAEKLGMKTIDQYAYGTKVKKEDVELIELRKPLWDFELPIPEKIYSVHEAEELISRVDFERTYPLREKDGTQLLKVEDGEEILAGVYDESTRRFIPVISK